MAPSGAGGISIHEMLSSFSLSSPSRTVSLVLARNLNLTADEGVMMTHLVVWLLAFLSVLFLGLRLGAKCYRRAGLGVDDALLAAAWAAVLFYSVISSLELALGLGTGDSSPSSPSSTSAASPGEGTTSPSSSQSLSSSFSSSSSSNTNAEALILLDHVARTFCLTAAAWSKSAVAVTLLKVPSRGNAGRSWNPALHGVLFGLIAVVNTGLAAAIIAHWFRCAPIAKEWDDSVDGSCWSMAVHGAISIAAQGFSGAMDVALVAIGLLIVWGSDLSVGGKVGVLGLSFLGIVASAASVATAVEIATLTDSNFISANLRILLVASIETPVVIITASLPSLRLFRKNYTPSSSPHPPSFDAAYLKHKDGDLSTSTTIRLLPTGGGVIHPHDGPPPPTSHSTVAPLRGKASFSSSVSGGIAPARPPRPDSGEMAGMGPGTLWADPTTPAALNGTTTISASNGRPGDESARGLLLSPGEAASPSPYTPGWGPGASSALSPAPTSAAPMISPHDNPPYPPYRNDDPGNNNNINFTNDNFNSQPAAPVDGFDTYHDNTPNFPGGLVAPRVLTPLEEEDREFNSRASSYRSSAISASTMTNSHWLDIPVPHPDEDGASRNSQRATSKFSMSGFLDSYGPRAASVLRKMDLIVPIGSSGGTAGVSQQQQQQHGGASQQEKYQQPGVNLGKPRNRDSPTLGVYWGSLPPSPAAPGGSATETTAPSPSSPLGRRADVGGTGLRNITGGAGATSGRVLHPWQQHMKDSSVSSYTSYSNSNTNNSNHHYQRY